MKPTEKSAMLPGDKRPTLRDVAASAKVSVATVSRVLNDSPLVNPDTEKRVRKAIDQLGFSPSASARALNFGRTCTVGAIVPTLDHAIFARFLDSLEQQLASHGLSLVVACAGGDAQREYEQTSSLVKIGVDALVLSGLERDTRFHALAKRVGLPVVATSCYRPGADYPTVGYDNADVVRLGMGHLWDLGHREIALIHGPSESNDRTRRRLKAAEQDDRFVITFHETTLDVAGGRQAAAEVLAGASNPTALFCLSDVLALGAVFACSHAGVAIPHQLSVLGMGDLEWAEHLNPPLSTIGLPVDDMGRDTATAVFEKLEHGTTIAPRLLGSELIARHSTGPKQ